MTNHFDTTGPDSGRQITLRSPAELADALPYMLGFHPDDSIVMVTVHGSGGRFGGRLRVGIPPAPEEWEELSGQVAETLIGGSERRGARPDGIVLFLCQDPPAGEDPARVMARLRPLAQGIRLACGALDVPVLEALCLSGGRYWSYCCPDPRCCPPEGTALAMPGTSVMAAAATYAGLQVRGTLKELQARFSPVTGPAAEDMVRALDRAAAALVPRILEGTDRGQVAAETLALARTVMRRLARATPSDGGPSSDAWDDALIDDEEAALLVLGLQDRETRDVAAEWMEGEEAGPALRLWRALARRCAGEYHEHAAAPLTLAGWVTWSMGDEPYARIAFSLALRADPGYRFALLLHHACNEGVDPESLRRCLRDERRRRDGPAFAEARWRRPRQERLPLGLAPEPPGTGLDLGRAAGPGEGPTEHPGRYTATAPEGAGDVAPGTWGTPPPGTTRPATPAARPPEPDPRHAVPAPRKPAPGESRPAPTGPRTDQDPPAGRTPARPAPSGTGSGPSPADRDPAGHAPGGPGAPEVPAPSGAVPEGSRSAQGPAGVPDRVVPAPDGPAPDGPGAAGLPGRGGADAPEAGASDGRSVPRGSADPTRPVVLRKPTDPGHPAARRPGAGAAPAGPAGPTGPGRGGPEAQRARPRARRPKGAPPSLRIPKQPERKPE
ncbi:DUF4192 family protein [Streptomyces sp. NPDC101132]|uniref:DUF4192 domain-containing protein n=1 Tax=Streptomyces sp. NPDC101132 TaxID=3366110 RepID=UPI0038106F23